MIDAIGDENTFVSYSDLSHKVMFDGSTQAIVTQERYQVWTEDSTFDSVHDFYFAKEMHTWNG